MSFFDVFILSFIQGISEFLPISSSGHLFIVQKFFYIHGGSLEFDVALHFGSVLSVIFFFYKDFIFLVKESFDFILYKTTKTKLFVQLFLATLPTIIAGFILISFDLINYFRSLPVIAFNLIFFGILLFVVDQVKPNKINLYEINNKQGFLIGLGQMLALIPGISRSGICITFGRFLGVEKTSSIKFAMLMSIPTILGASLLSALKLKGAQYIDYRAFIYGILLSFIFGIIFIKLLLEFVKKFSFKAFMIYRIILGCILLIMIII